MSWEILPPEKVVSPIAGIPIERAEKILAAFIKGATKDELARVFKIKRSAISEIVRVAQQEAQQKHFAAFNNNLAPLARKIHLLE